MIKIDVIPEGGFPVICAWCGKFIRWEETPNSHGICSDCKMRLLSKMRT